MPRPDLRLAILLVGIAAPAASAADPTLVASDRFAYSEGDRLAVDGGIAVGAPTALSTGLSTGLAAGVAYGRTLSFGARAAWMTATESTLAWRVTHAEFRLRATGAVTHRVGRGAFGLRLGLGGTLVRESRLRNQGERAGLTGDDLSTAATAMLPAGDLDAVVSLNIAGPWLVTVSGGPSLALDGGDALAGWSTELGVAWRP